MKKTLVLPIIVFAAGVAATSVSFANVLSAQTGLYKETSSKGAITATVDDRQLCITDHFGGTCNIVTIGAIYCQNSMCTAPVQWTSSSSASSSASTASNTVYGALSYRQSTGSWRAKNFVIVQGDQTLKFVKASE